MKYEFKYEFNINNSVIDSIKNKIKLRLSWEKGVLVIIKPTGIFMSILQSKWLYLWNNFQFIYLDNNYLYVIIMLLMQNKL